MLKNGDYAIDRSNSLNSLLLGNERKSEQAHIPQAPTLFGYAVYNKWQLVMGNRTENQFHLSCTK